MIPLNKDLKKENSVMNPNQPLQQTPPDSVPPQAVDPQSQPGYPQQPNNNQSLPPQPQPADQPKWVAQSPSKLGYAPTNLPPASIKTTQKLGFFLCTIILIPAGPFLYLLFVKHVYRIRKGIVYVMNQKLHRSLLILTGLLTLLALMRAI